MIKKPSHKERDALRERGKKKYLDRIVEEQEAEQEIKNYKPEETEYPNNDDKVQNNIR